jgi:hypothetical protein
MGQKRTRPEEWRLLGVITDAGVPVPVKVPERGPEPGRLSVTGAT